MQAHLDAEQYSNTVLRQPQYREMARQLARDVVPELDAGGCELLLVAIGTAQTGLEFAALTGAPAPQPATRLLELVCMACNWLMATLRVQQFVGSCAGFPEGRLFADPDNAAYDALQFNKGALVTYISPIVRTSSHAFACTACQCGRA